jgi:hypothetical protein
MSNPILAFMGSTAGAAAATATNPVTSVVSAWSNYAAPVNMPGLPELIASFQREDISAAEFEDFGRFQGFAFTRCERVFTYTKYLGEQVTIDTDEITRMRGINSRLLQAQSYMPSIDEAKVLFNRGLITFSLFNHIIRKQTTGNPALADAIASTRFEIPGPADLVRFAVRDVFSPEIVEQFEYAKETPESIKPWMDKQGYGQSIGLQLPPNATNAAGNPIRGEATWFDLFWQSHWDLPSPTQGYEMLHRLYPESPYGPSPFVTPETGFIASDLEKLLKASDYPDYWRKRLIAISYHNLNRSDVLPMFRFGLLQEREVYHALRADGYRDEEANQLLRLANFQKQRELGVDPAKKAKEWICKSYRKGLISRDNAIARLEEIGITRRFADSFLDTCDLEEQFELNQERIRTLKRGVITGVVTREGAENLLNRMNIQTPVITRYLDVWDHLKFSRYKNVTTRQNLNAFEKGLINRDELVSRLQNLGYTSVAISTMTGLADYNLQQKRLRLLQQQTTQELKLQRTRIKEAVANAKQEAAKIRKRESNIEKFNNKRIRSIVKASSDKNIIEWYKKELIQLWEVYYRLYYKDYSIADAAKWVLNKLPDLDKEEYSNAEVKAQKVYRSEPNPPLD